MQIASMGDLAIQLHESTRGLFMEAKENCYDKLVAKIPYKV
jgi:hypothetical protein